MAQTKINRPSNIVEKNIRLTEQVMRYLLNNPTAFDSLPDDFELVILPDDDPEVRSYNLDLLDHHGSEGKPVVFARVQSESTEPSDAVRPSLFVPIQTTDQIGVAI